MCNIILSSSLLGVFYITGQNLLREALLYLLLLLKEVLSTHATSNLWNSMKLY